MVVVVSAMSGVTNRLIEAATCSEAGDRDRASAILQGLGEQHALALEALIHDPETRKRLAPRIEENLRLAQRLCEGTALIHELTPRTLDAISSLGERLSAPLVAGALSEQGVLSEAIEATELIVTDSYHGAAEPLMDLTQQRSRSAHPPAAAKGNRSRRHRIYRCHTRWSSHHARPRRLGLLGNNSRRRARCG